MQLYDMPIIDLGAAGFKSLDTTGSIAAGSSTLTVASSAGFRAGDQVIIAVGGEAGHGQIGTVGVGGVYAASTSDPSLYYTNKDAPKALVAHVVSVGSDGHTLILDKAASASTQGATVSFDNKPVWDAVVAANQIPNVTLKIPDGKFAISDYLGLNYQSGWTLEGNGQTKSTIYSPDGAPSASIEVFQAANTTLQNFSLTGNAKLNGFGLGTLETYPPGIMFTSSNGSLAQNITVTDVFQDAVGTRYSDNTWAKNVDVHLTEGLARYIQWQFDWANSKGGGVVNSSVTSPTLTAGFEAFASQDVSFIGIKGINAAVAMNSSGNFLIKDADLTVTPNSWVSDLAFHHYNPLINVNGNFDGTSPLLALGGNIVNATIVQQGYINSAHNLLRGIAINANTPNITVSGGSYISPDSAAADDRGASGVDSIGQNTVVDGFKVSGAGYFNISLADGTVENSVAGTINVAAGHSINNSQPSAAFLAGAASLIAEQTSLDTPLPTTSAGTSSSGDHPTVELSSLGSVTHDGTTQDDQVYALYDAALGRVPTADELDGASNALHHGATLKNLAQSLVTSVNGSDVSDPTEFVQNLYETVFQRAGSDKEVQYWSDAISGGASRGDVLLSFALSTEHTSQLATDLAQGIFSPKLASLEAARLYNGVLGRAPDDGGLASWTAALKSGASPHDVAGAFISSREYAGNGSHSDAAFIDTLYMNALGRHVETGGLQYWLDALQHGGSRADIAIAIIDSAEGHQHFAVSVLAEWHLA